MEHTLAGRAGILPKHLIFPVLVCIFVCSSGCNQIKKWFSGSPPTHPEVVVRDSAWEAFNILLPDGATPDELQTAKLKLESDVDVYLKKWNRDSGSDFSARFNYVACPCDPSLVNANVALLSGSGTTYPPPVKGPSGSGDQGLPYSVDFPMVSDSSSDVRGDFIPTKYIFDPRVELYEKKALAIIDTGLDTSLFKGAPKWWIAGGTRNAIQNTLPGMPSDAIYDDHKEKHGSAVAALALQGAGRLRIPRLIIIKALDKNKMGSSYTVGCAVSCALQDGASAINASLGYYDTTMKNDPVLYRSMRKCDDAHIPVFAAAGNLRQEEGKMPQPCDKRSNSVNELRTGKRLFLPACYGEKFPYVVSVTGLRDPQNDCANQNFSEQYVKVGLVNKRPCCGYLTGFCAAEYTGTSFATPLVSGMVMKAAMENPDTDMLTLFSDLLGHSTNSRHTVNGAYIVFPKPTP